MSRTGLALASVLSVVAVASAQTWTGNGGDANWLTAANWQNGVVANSSTATALLSGNTTANLLRLDADITLSGLLFQNASNGTARAFTITDTGADGQPHDNAINIGADGITNLTTITQTINAVVALTNNSVFGSMYAGGQLDFLGTASNPYNEIRLNGHSLTVNGAGNTSIASPINGAGSLIKTGTGTLTLYGANTYTGTTTVSAGVLAVSNSGSLGKVSTSRSGLVFAGLSQAAIMRTCHDTFHTCTE